MNSNNRFNLSERDSHLLNRILNDLDLNTISSKPINDLINSIHGPSSSLSSSIGECCRLIIVAGEEVKVREEIVSIIVSGNTESLRANSGQGVMVAGHNICIGVQGSGNNERMWKWHGHIVLYEDELEFSPEYFYGSYNEIVALQE